MNVSQFPWSQLVIAVLALATGVRGAPSETQDDQQIRNAARAVLDASQPFDPAALELIVLESDVERRFATEMLKAMRAEQRMGRRAAVAVGGSEDSEAVRRADRAAAATAAAIAAAQPVVSGDTATLPFAPGGGRGTTLAFRKSDGGWRLDLLRRYRERNQVNDAGVARLKARQQAAEQVADIYEKKQERDLAVLPLLYETMSRQLADASAKPPAAPQTTSPKP